MKAEMKCRVCCVTFGLIPYARLNDENVCVYCLEWFEKWHERLNEPRARPGSHLEPSKNVEPARNEPGN